MSLSRPERFPLLKLPFLCIECVIKNWDIFDIIFFVLTSNRARQIVKHLKIPLNGIEVCLNLFRYITLGNSGKQWVFKSRSVTESFFKELLTKNRIVLQKNAIPLYTRKTGHSLESYTYGMNEETASKMVLDFLNDVFKCSVKNVWMGGKLPESGDIGVKSTVNLYIGDAHGCAQLKLLLENLEVIDTCTFHANDTTNDFYCDPKLFKCKKLEFRMGSAGWITRDILLQFEVPRLMFLDRSFPVEDILSFVTHWFHSDSKKLEYLSINNQSTQISLDKFQTEELSPVRFSGKTRIPPIDLFARMDFSVGLEIVRHDSLEASIYVNNGIFLFYVWHNQSAVTQS
ncbi:unnamed protein product [Caenorhabditis brenneri]